MQASIYTGSDLNNIFRRKPLKIDLIALMHDDIILAIITTKPRFENANFRFYHKLIPKAAMMKRIPT